MQYGVDILKEQGYDDGITAEHLETIAGYLEASNTWPVGLEIFIRKVFQEKQITYEHLQIQLATYRGEITSLHLHMAFEAMADWLTKTSIRTGVSL